MKTKSAVADYDWQNVVVGSDLKAVRFAYKNNYPIIKNHLPRHHSYEGIELIWAKMSYELYTKGLSPFLDRVTAVKVIPDNIIKVVTEHNIFTIKYQNLHIYDDTNVSGFVLKRELLCYRVVDWFDCRGLYDLQFNNIITDDKFVNIIKFFKSKRIDGDQKYLDLLCESFLTDKQIKSFEYSDTMARFKVEDLLKEHGVANPRMSLWKRDIFPVYKTI